jgi:hypothetical protein
MEGHKKSYELADRLLYLYKSESYQHFFEFNVNNSLRVKSIDEGFVDIFFHIIKRYFDEFQLPFLGVVNLEVELYIHLNLYWCGN